MTGPLGHSGSWRGRTRGRQAAARADGEALGELEARPLPLPPGLEVEWLGVSGYRLTYEGHTLLVDPYVSRVPFRDLILRRRALPDAAALERFVRAPGKTVGVLVGHTHFDHAVDAPALARRLDCKAYGSASLVNLMALHGMRRASGRGRPLPGLRARPVRGQLHPQRPLEAAARPRRPLRRRTDLRAPRLALPLRLPLRAGLGDHDRHRRPPLLPPGQRRPDRRRGPRAGRRRLPRGRRRAGLHRALLAADPAAARTARRRPHPLRQLLPPARPGARVRHRRRAGAAAGGDRRGQLRDRAGGAAARGPPLDATALAMSRRGTPNPRRSSPTCSPRACASSSAGRRRGPPRPAPAPTTRAPATASGRRCTRSA